MGRRKRAKIPIVLVEKGDKRGCTVACLAMVSGRTYAEVAKDFANDFSKGGMTSKWELTWLGDNGYSVCRKSIEHYFSLDDWRSEIFRPFADVHILTLMPAADSVCSHSVVMDSEGRLFCPDGVGEAEIRACYRVIEVLGLRKI